MTIPPSAPGRASRAALAARLAELRTAAGLSGNALAGRMGIVQSRVWKIEHEKLLPTERDIQAWAEATEIGDTRRRQLLEMLAEARSEQQFSTAYRGKGGPAALEERVRQAEERSQRIGEFQVAVIPGILQTADYAREVMSVASGVRAWGSGDADVEDKISVRLRRQEILYGSSKQIQAVIHEAALHVRMAAPETMAGQLDKLLAVSRLPAVELGVIPYSARMPAYPFGFRIYDEDFVVTESISREPEISDPAEMAVYAGAFKALREASVTGDEARALITSAAASLRENGLQGRGQPRKNGGDGTGLAGSPPLQFAAVAPLDLVPFCLYRPGCEERVVACRHRRGGPARLVLPRPRRAGHRTRHRRRPVPDRVPSGSAYPPHRVDRLRRYGRSQIEAVPLVISPVPWL